jgi:Cof subfamily protein (haloacid dehalogenase superfamily)
MKKKIDPSKIKALAIDLDGTTLLPGSILGERTRICLRELVSRGIQLIIATGRAIESSEQYINAMNASGPMVFCNGAEVADIPSGKMLYVNLIDLEVVNYGIELARDLGIHYQVYLPPLISPDTGMKDTERKWETLVMEKNDEEAEYYYNHTGIIPVIKDLKSIVALPNLEGCIKGMYIADPPFHDEIRRKMYDRFGDRISILRSYPTLVEVINKGVSKGEGLKIAMEHRGLKPDEVIAFGDEENDLSMFTVAGFSAAPESAREKNREAADIIYGPVEKEGLAEYLEKTFL